MSIRLRLALLYSAILTLTLVVFGVALYSIQARDSFATIQRDLAASSGRLTEAALRLEDPPPARDRAQPEPPPPRSFEDLPGGQPFTDLREREIVRVLDGEGNLVASPFGRAEDALPLDAAGLDVLQGGQDVWESALVAGENTLIYSRPIVRDGETAYIVQVARSLAERDRGLRTLALTLGGAGGVTILVAFLAGWWLSGLSLRPIRRLTGTARAIGEERDFTRRVAYDGPPDEVGQLAGTFNKMLAQLQDAYERIENALRLQRHFVADVSHELRTPLTTLRGNLGLLRRDPPVPPEEEADILADLVDESDRMIRLVNDLLFLARADAAPGLALAPLDLLPLLEESVRQARHLEGQRPLVWEADPGIIVLGDHDAIKQLLLILLDNALKHSTGEIRLEAERGREGVEIRVCDRGQGIPPDRLDRVFDRFYRGEDAANGPGFGLGLPIARALAERMGGSIAMESELGEGSVVIVRLPAAADGADAG